MTPEELINRAQAEGITVVWHIGDTKGAWFPRKQTISISNHLTPAETLCTLAHELGHATYGHTGECSSDSLEELQADWWAARALISRAEYAAAESLYDADLYLIAEELGVTVHLLQVYRGLLARVGEPVNRG